VKKSANNHEIKAFICRHRELFWYTPEDKKEDISVEFLVDTILNYGDLKSIKELISLMGITRMSKIFFNSINQSERRKGNYHELTLNFFALVFKPYAPSNFK
jgi:hypothetical protein